MSPTSFDKLNDSTEIAGVVILFIPYLIILLPRRWQKQLVVHLHKLYLHRTPRNDWHHAVGQAPPRRVGGYVCGSLFIFSGIILLLIKDNTNSFWLDIVQYFLYISLPLMAAILRPSSKPPCDAFDVCILLLVIVPMQLSQEFASFLPDIEFTIYSGWQTSPNISMLRITAFNVLLFIFLVFRPLTNIGLTWSLRRWFLCKLTLLRFVIILVVFLVFAVAFCLIPGIDYLHAASAMHKVWLNGIARFFCYFLFEVLMFEFFYRGIIQNLLHSAFEFHHEAKSYLRGAASRSSSVTARIEKLDREHNSNANEMKQALLPHGAQSVHPKAQSAVREQQSFEHVVLAMDAKSLPYYEKEDEEEEEENDGDTGEYLFNADDDMSVVAYEHKQRRLQKRGVRCYFLRIHYLRNWLAVVLASIIYAVTMVNYTQYEKHVDLVYAAIFYLWLGFCCGWLFRLTHSCFVSAIFNCLILYNFKYIFNPTPDAFCNGAC